ncbi:helix-turn-helix domain-containing protein [Streptomyces sp. PSKA30]|uniref:helix-turn-helix domain-containing protein n=1 Tax=Streptomyces sp. PSKA30 TaxID=2874597 RepID=UPI001CD16A35|nr:helix-turn-helix domain-containing protein [Streptomyces sp. PSKA30]MBZ9638110.1 helix-turn-helix domain-containing protein [Streptomyces sp. PSKA30]
MTPAALYSTEEVADMLGLNVRTVRSYVRDGRLPAVRIGKQYRIAPEDVERLTGGHTTAAPATPEPVPARVEVTAIVQVEGVDGSAMTRLSALVTGAVSNRPGNAARLHAETVYDQQRRTVKIVAIGSADDTATLVSLIGTFAEAEL